MRRGLGFHNRRSPGVFSPSSLFQGGIVAGAWYDPSDATTLFTTSAGTTPCAEPGAGALVVVGRMLDKSGNGNHANAANDTTARPELSARVNLLTYSEQFDNAVWSKLNVNITQNAATAPDGTLSADLIVPNTSNTEHYVSNNTTGASPGVTWIYSCYVKDAGYSYVMMLLGNQNGPGASKGYLCTFDLQNNTFGGLQTFGSAPLWSNGAALITDVGNGWKRIQITATADPSSTTIGGGFYPLSTFDITSPYSFAGNGTSGVLAWGADLRFANIGANVPAYQRVADQYTYDTVGFPRYLRFDGVDDAMSTPANVNLSGTDKATVFAGVRKLSDAAGAILCEFSTNAYGGNNGAFAFAAPAAASASYDFRSQGTNGVSATYTNSLVAAPVTNVLTGIGNISLPVATLRTNGAQVANSTSTQGTGNYGSYPLYIGARNNASVFLNGSIYSLLVVGSAVSAGNITATESWVAGKTGITI